MDYIIVVLYMAAILMAFLALVAESRIVAVAFMFGCTVVMGLLFMYVGATFVGVFNLLVYAGVLTVLFASTSHILESERDEEGTIGQVEVGGS